MPNNNHSLPHLHLYTINYALWRRSSRVTFSKYSSMHLYHTLTSPLMLAIKNNDLAQLIIEAKGLDSGLLPDEFIDSFYMMALKHADSLIFYHLWSLTSQEQKTIFRHLDHTYQNQKLLLEALKHNNLSALTAFIELATREHWFIINSPTYTQIFTEIVANEQLEAVQIFLNLATSEKKISLLNTDAVHDNLQEFSYHGKFKILKCLLLNMLEHNLISYMSFQKILTTAAECMHLPIVNLMLNLLGYESIEIKRTKSLIEQVQAIVSNPPPLITNLNPKAAAGRIVHARLFWQHLFSNIYGEDVVVPDGNIESPTLLIAARKQFEGEIKPAYLDAFNSYGQTDLERLDNIEKEIRLSLLNMTLQDPETRAAFKEFIKENMDKLSVGQDRDIMRAAQIYFYEKTHPTHVCWAAYDRYSDAMTLTEETINEFNNHDEETENIWPNLFVRPQPILENREVYSTIEITNQSTTLNDAVYLARERAAYMFLISQTPDGKKNEILQALIGAIFSILRANSKNDLDNHNPSCLPGTLTRLYFVAQKHPQFYSTTNPADEERERRYRVILSNFNTIVENSFLQAIEKMALSNKIDRIEKLFNALCFLRNETYLTILKGESFLGFNGEITYYTAEMEMLRNTFIFQYLENLENTISEQLTNPLSDHEIAFLHYLKLVIISSAEMIGKLHMHCQAFISQPLALKDLLEEDPELQEILKKIKTERLAKQAKKEPARMIEYKIIPTESVIFKKLVQLGYEQYKAAREAEAKALERAIVPYHETAVVSYRAPKFG